MKKKNTCNCTVAVKFIIALNYLSLIYFDIVIDLAHEKICSPAAYGPAHEKEVKAEQERRRRGLDVPSAGCSTTDDLLMLSPPLAGGRDQMPTPKLL